MKKLLPLLGFVALAQSAGFLVAPATIGSINDGWYDALDKPQWTPPKWVFGPVWTILFCFMGIAAWRVWRQREQAPHATKEALNWWGVQLVLNALWSLLFFGVKKPKWAAGEIVALWLAIAATTRAFGQRDQTAGALMGPYLAWVSYAMALSLEIARRND